MVDPCTAHRSHGVIMKLSENSCRCGGTSCPAFISWRLDTKESDRPSHTGNNSMFFLQIPVKYNVVCACCCRIHSGKISFYNKNPKYVVAFVSMINCGKINFFCLRSCIFYCSSLRPRAAILFISRDSQLSLTAKLKKVFDGNFILRS